MYYVKIQDAELKQKINEIKSLKSKNEEQKQEIQQLTKKNSELTVKPLSISEIEQICLCILAHILYTKKILFFCCF